MNWRFKIGIYPWRTFEEAQLLRSGVSFFKELIDSINKAKTEILFQVYIFDWDSTGKEVHQALLNAANRGVKVSLWCDAYGSANLLNLYQKNVLDSRLKIQFYSPVKLFSKKPIGMRLHHKIMVFDRNTALIGGINISDHYRGTKTALAWLDYGIKLTGEVAKDLARICLNTGVRFKRFHFEPTQIAPIGSTQKTEKIRVLENNWLKGKFAISKQYKVQTRFCKDELWIINSYFIPSNALIHLLKKAVKRKVKVNLILGGKSDVKLVKHASAYFYTDLLKSGIQIYEYTESVLHAKLAFADDDWLCIGSYNLNHLSDFGSIECNVEIKNQALVSSTKAQLLKDTLPKCIQITPQMYTHQNTVLIELRNYLSFQLLRLLLNILFLFQGHNNRLNKGE